MDLTNFDSITSDMKTDLFKLHAIQKKLYLYKRVFVQKYTNPQSIVSYMYVNNVVPLF